MNIIMRVQNNPVETAEIKQSSKPELKEDRRFDKYIQSIEANDVYVKLTAKLEEILKWGEKLSKHVDIKDLKHYKKLVSDFLYETVNMSHKFNKEDVFDRRGRHKMYAIVNKVNETMDDLTKEVLKEEKDNIKILAKLEDIRGMLIDILM